MEQLGFKIEFERLLIEDGQSRFEDFIMPQNQINTHISVYHLSRVTLFMRTF